MKNKCKINIEGKSNNQENTVSLYVVGTYANDNRSEVIEYEEEMDNGGASTVIIITDGIVTVNRCAEDGASTMVFERGSATDTRLITPMGEVGASIRCTDVQILRETGSVRVLLEYAIYLESGELINDSVLTIHCVHETEETGANASIGKFLEEN